MNKNELYLKTLFCCSACDGEVVEDEVALIKRLTGSMALFQNMNVNALLESYTAEINQTGFLFLEKYLAEISDAQLSEEEQLQLVDVTFQMMDADEKIEYSEIAFFKEIRSRLSVADDVILKHHPDKEDFLLPDIRQDNTSAWGDDSFSDKPFSDGESQKFNIVKGLFKQE